MKQAVKRKRGGKPKVPASPPKPLSERASAFVAAYSGPGSGAHAARIAGYSGTARTLEVRASKLLADPRVQQALRARGFDVAGADAPRPEPAPPVDAASIDPIQVWAQIAADPRALPSARAKAAAELRRARREDEEQRRTIGDPFERLRTKVREILAKKRARERSGLR